MKQTKCINNITLLYYKACKAKFIKKKKKCKYNINIIIREINSQE